MKRASLSATPKWRPSTSKATPSIPSGITPSSPVPAKHQVEALISRSLLKPKDDFRECTDCPAMVVLPAGLFTMGSPPGEPGRCTDEGPQHEVRIAKPLAVAQFPITVDEFKSF